MKAPRWMYPIQPPWILFSSNFPFSKNILKKNEAHVYGPPKKRLQLHLSQEKLISFASKAVEAIKSRVPRWNYPILLSNSQPPWILFSSNFPFSKNILKKNEAHVYGPPKIRLQLHLSQEKLISFQASKAVEAIKSRVPRWNYPILLSNSQPPWILFSSSFPFSKNILKKKRRTCIWPPKKETATSFNTRKTSFFQASKAEFRA